MIKSPIAMKVGMSRPPYHYKIEISRSKKPIKNYPAIRTVRYPRPSFKKRIPTKVPKRLLAPTMIEPRTFEMFISSNIVVE